MLSNTLKIHPVKFENPLPIEGSSDIEKKKFLIKINNRVNLKEGGFW